jgi:hypothetical protein
LDLLGGDFAADLGGAGLGPMAGGQMGNPLGLPPNRGRKSRSNKTLFIVLGSLAGVGLLVVCGGIGVALLLPAVQAARQAALRAQARNGATSAAPVGPVWAPDPQFANQLPTKATCDRYSLDLPAGFTPQPVPAETQPAGLRVHSQVWGGPQSPGGTAMIGVDVIDSTLGPLRADELELALTTYLQTMQTIASLSGFQTEAVQHGQVAGKPCVRARFSGMALSVRLRGVAYIILDGDRRALRTFAACPSGHSNPTFEQIEAALLTLH